MKSPIPMPVKAVKVRHSAPGDWTADITFGAPGDDSRNDPMITLRSGEGIELPPNVGDVLLVRPPEIVAAVRWVRSQYPHPKFPSAMRGMQLLPDVIWLRYHGEEVTGWSSDAPNQ